MSLSVLIGVKCLSTLLTAQISGAGAAYGTCRRRHARKLHHGSPVSSTSWRLPACVSRRPTGQAGKADVRLTQWSPAVTRDGAARLRRRDLFIIVNWRVFCVACVAKVNSSHIGSRLLFGNVQPCQAKSGRDIGMGTSGRTPFILTQRRQHQGENFLSKLRCQFSEKELADHSSFREKSVGLQTMHRDAPPSMDSALWPDREKNNQALPVCT